MEFIVAKSRYSRQLDSIMYETHMKKKIIIAAGTNVPSKKGVDTTVSNIDLTQINFVITKNTFPNYKGDFDKDKNGEYQLKELYTYPNGAVFFDINKKGLVTKGSKTIPSAAWSKFDFEFIDEKLFPSTPETMGIRNVSKRKNGFTNNLLAYKKEKGYPRPSSPVLASEVVNFFKGKNEYVVGDTILSVDDTSLDNDFTKIDGTSLDKKTNEDLFELITDKFGLELGGLSRGKPWCMANRTLDDVDISLVNPTFEMLDIPLLNNLAGSTIITFGQTIMFCGGFRGNRNTLSDDIITLDVVGGELKNARLTSKLPEKMAFASSYITEDYVFIFGGVSNMSVGNITPCKSWRIKKLPNGKLGPWEEIIKPLPKYSLTPRIMFVKNRIYVIGGKTIDDGYIDNTKLRYRIDLSDDLNSKFNWVTEKDAYYIADSNNTIQFPYSRPENSTATNYKRDTGTVVYMDILNLNRRDLEVVSTGIRNRVTSANKDNIDISYASGFSIIHKNNTSLDGNSSQMTRFQCKEGNTLNMNLGYASSRTQTGAVFNNIPIDGQSLARIFFNVVITRTSLYLIGGTTESIISENDNSTSLRVLKRNYKPHDSTLMEDWDNSVKTVTSDPNKFSLPYINKILFNGVEYSLFMKNK